MERRNGMSLREAMRLNAKAKQQQQQSEAASGAGALTRAYRQARASGQLNASTRSLTEFPADILRLHEMVEGDEKTWECQPLTKVDLSYNEIPSLPPTIAKLRMITSIKLRHNKLTELPDEFFGLSTLTSIDLSNNAFEGAFPESLGRLTNLRELGLENNKLTSLPDSLCVLENLEILRVEENQLTELPADFGNLQKLHTLGAHSNQLTTLPPTFGRLTNLTTLDLKKNALATIGRAAERLTRLTFLDLRQNRLQEFPFLPLGAPPLDQLMLGYNVLPEIDEESVLRVKESLTVLDLRDNKLKDLPGRFPHLYRLKSLDLSNNDLHDLPPGLGYLKYLNSILIDGNPLRSIRRSAISAGTQSLKKYLRTRGSPPQGVDTLEQEFDEFALRDLQQKEDELGGLVLESNNEVASQYEHIFRDAASNGSLQMVDMRLQTIPEQIQAAGKYRFGEALVQLNLSKNRLSELPSVIGELQALQTLIAEECGLKTIDASISMLPNLQHLRLRKNFLTAETMDSFLQHEDKAELCHSLKELDLRNNTLREMPTRFRFLVSVDTLMLGYNRLKYLDDFPWAAMRRLSVVSLADNQLESIGTVYELPLLTSLSVENNNLRQIPSELGACENLRALYIAGNPQRSVRLNIVSEGTDAILKHLKNRLPFGFDSPAKAFVDTAPKLPSRGNNQQDNSENSPPKNTRSVGIAKPAATPLANTITSSINSSVNNQATHESPNPAEYKRARRATALSSDAHIDLRQPSFGYQTPQKAATPSPFASSSFVTPPPAPQRGRSTPGLFSTPGLLSTPGATPTPAATTSSATNGADDAVLQEYETRIKTLEAQLEDYALSQAKKFALKKELAMVRSQKIRHLRTAGDA